MDADSYRHWTDGNGGEIPPSDRTRQLTGMWAGFSDSTNEGCASVSAENIEREIAENIFDWWISKKSYKKWYAEKFLQQHIDFKE
jgi:hypothetical protein